MPKDIIKPEWIPAAYRSEKVESKAEKSPAVRLTNPIVKTQKKRPGLTGRFSEKY